MLNHTSLDKDEVACHSLDQWHHPHYSTATYLDLQTLDEHSTHRAGGAPLIVFNTTSEEPSFRARRRRIRLQKSQSRPSRCWAVFPTPGRHVAFDGRYLHGVAAELLTHEKLLPASFPSSKYARLSLLVNIWTSHKPIHLSRLSLPAQDVPSERQLEGVRSLFEGVLPSTARSVEVKNVRNVQPNNCDVHFLKEHIDGDTAPLPLAPLREEFLLANLSRTENAPEHTPHKPSVVEVIYCL